MRDQRIVIHGAGTAGIGIADVIRNVMVREGMSPEEPTRRFCSLGRRGLLADDRAENQYEFQRPYARPAGEVGNWSSGDRRVSLADVVFMAAVPSRRTDLFGRQRPRG
jgi:malate dehydrogenase (oxaloacetate-decarboxylating)